MFAAECRLTMLPTRFFMIMAILGLSKRLCPEKIFLRRIEIC